MGSAMSRCLLAVILLLVCCWVAASASVRVEPVLVEVEAPGSATTLTLRNDDHQAIDVQIRIFRWSQSNGQEHLEPTTDVVVSPPLTTLSRGAEYLVRVVRVAPRPVEGEESYRVIVDEIPDRAASRSGIVKFALRYSIPVFFLAPQTPEPRLAWSIDRSGAHLVVAVQNSGGKRLRISNVKLRDSRGVTVSLRDGLVGYVLGGAAMRWPFRAALGAKLSGDTVRLTADTDSRPIDATIMLGPGR